MTPFTTPGYKPLKKHGQLEPDVVAFEAVFHVNFRKPFQFPYEIFSPDLCNVGNDRADPDRTPFHIAQARRQVGARPSVDTVPAR